MGQDYSYTQPSSSLEELDITSLIVVEGELYANEVESNNFTISQEYQYAAAPEADEGIPRTCYCGSEPVVKTSYTPKNPYRRYFSCNNVDDGECHIWKWWDVALQEELRETQIQLRMLKDQFFESDQKVAKLEKILRVLSKKTAVAKYRFAKGVCLLLLLILVIVMWRKSLGGFKHQCLNSSWPSKNRTC
uniref:GRF-type domain-containing protein n=1 Tax=Brassica campestris TaxID=3711 RepID=M4D1F1_BRACM